MAYNSVRERDPLIDKETQRVLERRLMELLGIVMIALASLFSLIIFTYSPTDPGPLSASDLPVDNFFGNTGAAISSLLILVIGWGSWSLAPIFLIWGVRFLLHIGSERAIGRLLFAPIAIALASIYAASIVPANIWAHNFGMGGLFGDTVVGLLLTLIPLSASHGILVITLISLILTIVLNIFCCGFINSEIKNIIRFLFTSSNKTLSLFSIGLFQIISSIRKKTNKTKSFSISRKELEQPHGESFLPKAPALHQVSNQNFYDEGRDPYSFDDAPSTFAQEDKYYEHKGGGNIFFNSRLSSKISAAINSRSQIDQTRLSKDFQTDEGEACSEIYIKKK